MRVQSGHNQEAEKQGEVMSSTGKSYQRVAIVMLGFISGSVVAQSGGEPIVEPTVLRSIPAETTAAAYIDPDWEVPRTSWGHPSLEGVWSTDDMRSVPMNRPERFGTRERMTDEEFLERARNDENGRDFAVNIGTFLRHEWGIRSFGYTSLITDPPNGRMPEATALGKAMSATRPRGTFGPGPFNSFDDFSLYDRCITRGALGSFLPVIYGNGLRIVQNPNFVALSYEMIHETRIVPLDGRRHVDDRIRQYLGNARGYWDGDTLVIETTNFTNRTNVGANGGGPANTEGLKLTERFTRVDPGMIEFTATVEDPDALTAPFTLRVMITTQPDYRVYEYSCHEGNGAVINSLTGERVYEKQVEAALAKGLPAPARAVEHSEIRNADFEQLQIFDINAGE